MPSGSPALRALGSVGMALVCSTPISTAAAPSPGQASQCPALEAIEEAASRLLGRSQAGDDRLDEAIQVQDLGDRYVVRMKGGVRTFVDEARDCDARARAAAVFVALTLLPSPLDAPEPARGRPPPPMAPPPPIAPSAPAAQATRSSWVEIELGGMGALAPRSDASLFVVGAELRLILTQQRWGVTLGGSLPTTSTLDLGTARVRQARFPFDMGLRASWHSSWLLGALDLGPLAALCQFRQADLMNARTTSRIEFGVRGAVTLAIEIYQSSLFIRSFTEFVPVTHEIAFEPRGTIGRTSALWTGITVGFAGKFH